jgi:formate-dependent nitrite reductase membrane component NrfD
MNTFVADPQWGWWIILYFFLGGIAAGAYFLATLIEWIGNEQDRGLARVGYRIAFPLVLLCGLFLTVDLERPERFWHMLLKSEVVEESLRQQWPWTGRSWSWMARAPLLKYWSPMSVGSWALLIFGFCSALSFAASVWPEGRLAHLLRRPWLGRPLSVIGSLIGFFIAAYTGALVTATNQPLWSDSVWIAPLFLTSAASTGSAAMILFARRASDAEALERLRRADLWALSMELLVFAVFLASLGALLGAILDTWHGKLLASGPLLLGLVVPLALHLGAGASAQRSAIAAAILTLVGGFLLRYAILTTPAELLVRGPGAVVGFSPEDGRRPGQSGADAGNRAPELKPRSKVFQDDSP